MAKKSGWKRIFNFSQEITHPTTGEHLIDENIIKSALSHKSITRYAYILHDKDRHTDGAKKGELKAPHYHVVIEMKNAYDPLKVASWFNLPVNFLKFPKGRGAFLDCVEYLTHEEEKQQKLNKHLYADEEVHSNFDFRKALDSRAKLVETYGRELSLKEQWRYDVLYNGKPLSQCEAEDPLLFLDEMDRLTKLRNAYLTRKEPPKIRINFYICGKGGVGKGLISRAIARSLYPDLEKDSDIFFEVGAKGSAFEGYDGQPVIIWNDRRAIDLLTELNGRGNVFNVFDTHPTKQRQNIKYGSVCLCNEVNIVNSVEDYLDFLNGLAGEYKDKSGDLHECEDKGQSFRRFPFIIPLHEKDFDLLLNRGFVENTDRFEDYIEYNHIRGNMQMIAERCKSNEELARCLEAQTILPITNKYHEVMAQFEEKLIDEEAILEEFSNNGKMISPIPPKAEPKKPTEPVNKKPIIVYLDDERINI